MYEIETDHRLIEEILSKYRKQIGTDYEGYRGHIYRVLNFCLALRDCTEEEKTKIVIAACFHDIGLWLNQSIDYLAPSITHLKKYLDEVGLGSWSQELALMVDMHHKVRVYKGNHQPLVEVFRQGDLIDVSWGLINFGLPNEFVKSVQAKIPNAGFHQSLVKEAKLWFFEHPFSIPPFIKW